MIDIEQRVWRRAGAGWLCLMLLFWASYSGVGQTDSKPGVTTNRLDEIMPPMPPLPVPGMSAPGTTIVTRARRPLRTNTAVRTMAPRTVPSTAAAVPPSLPAPAVNFPTPLPPGVLAFDAERKEVQLKAGEQKAHFVFYVTNVCATNVLITGLRPSCGCTVAKLPQQPWPLAPGQSGPVEADMSVYVPSGTVTKALTVETSAGIKHLILAAKLPALVNTNAAGQTNLQIKVGSTNAVPTATGFVVPVK